MYNEEGEQLEDYRQFSAWSFAAFLVALPAPLAIVHPAFVAVGVLAIFLAMVGLLWARKDPAITGLGFARFALGWSILWGVCGISAEYLDYRQHTRQARTFASRWLSMVQNQRFEEAFMLTKAPSTRPLLTDKGMVPAPAMGRTAQIEVTTLDDFKQSNIILEMQKTDYQGEMQFDRVVRVAEFGVESQFWLLYQFIPKSSDVRSFYIIVRLDQLVGPVASKRYWQVGQWDIAKG